jgi:UDP:flavonoid glycosyltransferase YjiC (YdhE family)
MKLLIAPLAAPAETHGSMARTRALAVEAVKRGHRVALCAAEDSNYLPIQDVKNHPAPVPSLFGTPPWLGKGLAHLARLTGLQRWIRVRSFEQVLSLIGATARSFFARDVAAVRQAIGAFEPDVVFAEFRLAAIVAARLEQVRVVTDYAYVGQPSFASSPAHSGGVREYLREHGLPAVRSALELFDWADIKFVASSYELEPIDGPNVIHVGPFQSVGEPRAPSPTPGCLLAYAGTGPITPARLLRVLSAACRDLPLHLYLASAGLEPFDRGAIHVRPWFDFDALLAEALASIHHGGQNSVMSALVHGVPQIVVCGDHFERGYNADSVVRLGAGVKLDPGRFTPERVRAWLDVFAHDPGYRGSALAAGKGLLSLGGAAKVLETLERRFGEGREATCGETVSQPEAVGLRQK